MVILDAESLKRLEANRQRAAVISAELADLATEQCEIAGVEDDESTAAEALKETVFSGVRIEDALAKFALYQKC
jgi:hypothetical protein